jgi:hypothetical protein
MLTLLMQELTIGHFGSILEAFSQVSIAIFHFDFFGVLNSIAFELV